MNTDNSLVNLNKKYNKMNIKILDETIVLNKNVDNMSNLNKYRNNSFFKESKVIKMPAINNKQIVNEISNNIRNLPYNPFADNFRMLKAKTFIGLKRYNSLPLIKEDSLTKLNLNKYAE